MSYYYELFSTKNVGFETENNFGKRLIQAQEGFFFKVILLSKKMFARKP